MVRRNARNNETTCDWYVDRGKKCEVQIQGRAGRSSSGATHRSDVIAPRRQALGDSNKSTVKIVGKKVTISIRFLRLVVAVVHLCLLHQHWLIHAIWLSCLLYMGKIKKNTSFQAASIQTVHIDTTSPKSKNSVRYFVERLYGMHYVIQIILASFEGHTKFLISCDDSHIPKTMSCVLLQADPLNPSSN